MAQDPHFSSVPVLSYAVGSLQLSHRHAHAWVIRTLTTD